MTRTQEAILTKIEAYYTEKLLMHGPSAKGVDWASRAEQDKRFEVLSRLFEDVRSVQVIEIGCGYGAFVDYCDAVGREIDYVGYDVSEAMIAAARARHAGRGNVRFEVGSAPAETADFCVASGIFNVKLDVDGVSWETYIFETIDMMARVAKRGFSFNCLTAFADTSRKEERLYYASPGRMLDHCLQRFGRSVALLHDYAMYEFTVLVRNGSPLGVERQW